MDGFEATSVIPSLVVCDGTALLWGAAKTSKVEKELGVEGIAFYVFHSSPVSCLPRVLSSTLTLRLRAWPWAVRATLPCGVVLRLMGCCRLVRVR